MSNKSESSSTHINPILLHATTFNHNLFSRRNLIQFFLFPFQEIQSTPLKPLPLFMIPISPLNLSNKSPIFSIYLKPKSPFSLRLQGMWLFQRKGLSGFSSSSTAEEVTNGIDGSGLTAIVTGASSGIGSETARVLALRGVNVVMGVRNMSAGNQVKESIIKAIPDAKVDALELDLSSLASVRKFASEFTSSNRPLNLLINNAGIMAPPFMLSKDNIELQFATNHLGHFLLTNLLLDTMKKTASKTNREGRIVNVASEAHRLTYTEGVRFDKINNDEEYKRWPAYGQSKLANVLHANELTRRLKEEGANITANSLHPGVINTNLFRHMGIFEGNLGVFEGVVSTVGKLLLKNVQQGASTTCYVAMNPQVKGVGGEYFSDNNLAKATPTAMDKVLAKKLWDFSIDMTKS